MLCQVRAFHWSTQKGGIERTLEERRGWLSLETKAEEIFSLLPSVLPSGSSAYEEHRDDPG